MQKFLDIGAIIDFINHKGDTALNKAVAANRLETVKFLINKGAYTGYQGNGVPFSFAVTEQMMKYFLDSTDMSPQMLYIQPTSLKLLPKINKEMIEKIMNLYPKTSEPKENKTAISPLMKNKAIDLTAISQYPTDFLVQQRFDSDFSVRSAVRKELLKRDINIDVLRDLLIDIQVRDIPDNADPLKLTKYCLVQQMFQFAFLLSHFNTIILK